MVKKTQHKNEGARNFKKTHFTMCHFPAVRSTFFNDEVSNDMLFWSIHWVISMIFCKLTLWPFFSPKMGGPNHEKGSKFGSFIEISNPKTFQRCPFRPKKGPKKEPIPGLGWRRRLTADRTPWKSSSLLLLAPRRWLSPPSSSDFSISSRFPIRQSSGLSYWPYACLLRSPPQTLLPPVLLWMRLAKSTHR